MTKNELTLTMGTIANCISELNSCKIKLKENIDMEYSDPSRNNDYYNKRKAFWTDECNKDVASLKATIKGEIEKLREHVGTPFKYSAELGQSVDYLATMQTMGALSNGMVENEIEKYKGNEAALLYLQGKMEQAGIHSRMFDDCMFSTYETDINGQKQFVPPTKYFDELEKTIERGKDILTANILKQTEQILGVESAGLENLNTSITERIDAVDIPVVY